MKRFVAWGKASAVAAYVALDPDTQDDLIAFLLTLGGLEQATGGLLLPGQPIPEVGEYGAPVSGLDEAGLVDFGSGRALFDHEFGFADGAGAPRFNGDSCRACHFEPVIGGAGPRGVNVVRHGIVNAAGEYVEPTVGSILHRGTALADTLNAPQEAAQVFEPGRRRRCLVLG